MLSTRGRLTALLTAATVALTTPRSGATVAALGGDDLPAALAALLELGLLAAAAWTLVCLVLGSLRGATGRLGRSLLPAALRTALFTGVAGTALVAPAHAADGGWPLDGLQLPERTTVTAPQVAGRTDVPEQRAAEHVVVREGDTLWSLARTGLDDEATDSQVSREVRRWHRENHDVIGADPDVLRPGQRLQAPTGTRTDR